MAPQPYNPFDQMYGPGGLGLPSVGHGAYDLGIGSFPGDNQYNHSAPLRPGGMPIPWDQQFDSRIAELAASAGDPATMEKIHQLMQMKAMSDEQESMQAFRRMEEVLAGPEGSGSITAGVVDQGPMAMGPLRTQQIDPSRPPLDRRGAAVLGGATGQRVMSDEMLGIARGQAAFKAQGQAEARYEDLAGQLGKVLAAKAKAQGKLEAEAWRNGPDSQSEQTNELNNQLRFLDEQEARLRQMLAPQPGPGGPGAPLVNSPGGALPGPPMISSHEPWTGSGGGGGYPPAASMVQPDPMSPAAPESSAMQVELGPDGQWRIVP